MHAVRGERQSCIPFRRGRACLDQHLARFGQMLSRFTQRCARFGQVWLRVGHTKVFSTTFPYRWLRRRSECRFSAQPRSGCAICSWRAFSHAVCSELVSSGIRARQGVSALCNLLQRVIFRGGALRQDRGRWTLVRVQLMQRFRRFELSAFVACCERRGGVCS